MPRGAALLVACVSLVGPLLHSADAQTKRAFAASRPVRGERLLDATLDFGSGRVVIQPGQSGELFRAALRYDAERSAPVQDYDPRTGRLHLGLESIGGGGVRVTSREQLEQTARFEFSPDIPLSLTANLGAANATIDLGGTTLTELVINSGATVTSLSFSRPTRGECRHATFTVGASELDARHLANAGCGVIEVQGGVGRAALGFEGEWRRDVAVVVEMAMGGLTLRVPRSTGLQITAARFLSTLDAEGLTRSGNVWSTPGFATAKRKITVALQASMAGVNVEWIGPK